MYIPNQKDVPSVSIRIITHEGGALLMVTSLKIGLDVSDLTQITIAAQPVHPDIRRRACTIATSWRSDSLLDSRTVRVRIVLAAPAETRRDAYSF